MSAAIFMYTDDNKAKTHLSSRAMPKHPGVSVSQCISVSAPKCISVIASKCLNASASWDLKRHITTASKHPGVSVLVHLSV